MPETKKAHIAVSLSRQTMVAPRVEKSINLLFLSGFFI